MGFNLSRLRRASYEMDMTSGPIMGKLIKFAIPLALSGILQLLFNAADIIVVGRFAGSQALAAVGATSALIHLMVTLFMGLSVGVNVLVARYYGAGQIEELKKTVHTAVTVSLVCGVFLIFAGFFLSRPLLRMMSTPDDVIDQAALYMRIYFAGMPAMLLYNFGAAILRSVGDTQRPLYFLTLAGVVNVVMNLIFVIVFHMGVAGVATATLISQIISAALVLLCLVKSDAVYSVNLKQLRIHKDKLWQMTKIGVPAGVQGATFAISNVLIQSTINSFGSVAMAGSTAAGNIEGFVFTGVDAFSQAALSFTSQNYGAGKAERINKITAQCILLGAVVGLVMGVGAFLAGRPLLGIYTSDPEVVEYGMTRLLTNCVPYFIYGVMCVLGGIMRGLGSSIAPMMISIFGVCVLRIAWIYTIFPLFPTWVGLFVSYPCSWVVTTLIEVVGLIIVRKSAMKKLKARAEAG